jgi:hypothetical protein
MRLGCVFALLAVAACYESTWIQRLNKSQCLELCADDSDRDCLLSAEYNWTTRDFEVSLKMCTAPRAPDSENNCFFDDEYSWIHNNSQPLNENISVTHMPCVRGVSFESQYDSWEITMRTVYRENAITPMRLYRNTTPEYKALVESTNNNQDSVSIVIPYRFIMQYAGTRDQAASAALQSVQTLMHLYAIEDTGWWHSFEFEKSGRNQHDVLVFQNGSGNNMQDACAAGFKRSYQDERDYVCIGNKCGMYPPCTSVNVPLPCAEDTFRLLAGPACRSRPPAGSLCDRMLRYITGQESAAGMSLPVQKVLPRIVDLQCVNAGAGMYVLVDALAGNSSEHEALAELLGLQDAAAAPVRCCVAEVDTGAAVGVCQMCSDAGSSRRRLLAGAETEGQDLSLQRYAVNTSQAQPTADSAEASDTGNTSQAQPTADSAEAADTGNTSQAQATADSAEASDTGSSGSRVVLIAVLSTAGFLVLLAACIYLSFCARMNRTVQQEYTNGEDESILRTYVLEP